mgnify:CR=1 FL=1
MNIDRKRFPIIQQVQNGQLDLPMALQELNVYSQFLPVIQSIVRSKPTVDYLCTTQVNKALGTAFDMEWSGFYNTKGILLYEGSAIAYKVEVLSDGSVDADIFIYVGQSIAAYSKVYIMDGLIYLQPHSTYMSEGIKEAVLTALGSILFKRHVQVETKIISTQRSRTCQTANGKVKTDFKYPINIINSHYYTNFIKGNRFPVKGHKRQYKSGKVVEIAPFVKSGYTRCAGKQTLAA